MTAYKPDKQPDKKPDKASLPIPPLDDISITNAPDPKVIPGGKTTSEKTSSTENQSPNGNQQNNQSGNTPPPPPITMIYHHPFPSENALVPSASPTTFHNPAVCR